jgi:hypothetical protein
MVKNSSKKILGHTTDRYWLSLLAEDHDLKQCQSIRPVLGSISSSRRRDLTVGSAAALLQSHGYLHLLKNI